MKKTVRSVGREEHSILAAELKRLREKSGLTLRQFGPAINHTHNYVSRIELGHGYIDFASLRDWIEVAGEDFIEVMTRVDADCRKIKNPDAGAE